MNALFVHRFKDHNIGDDSSCPARHFDWPSNWNIRRQDIDEMDLQDVANVDLLVVGGGGLLHPHIDMKIRDLRRAVVLANPLPYTVIWGVGANYHNLPRAHWHNWISEFDRVGLRDMANPWNVVPCASCMAKAFDITKPEPIDPFVVFEHWERPLDLPYPTMQNRPLMFEDLRRVIEFLSGGAVVITNSFHGAYWGQLLCKPVIVIDPFASRFHCGLPWPVTFASKQNYLERVGEALLRRPTHHLIDSCRRTNEKFFSSLINQVSPPVNIPYLIQ